LIAVGLAYGLHRGGDVMGVDFAGGDALSLKYDKQIEVADVRKAIEATGLTDALVQYQSGAENVLAITVPFEKGAGVEAALVKTFPDAKFTRLSLDTVGPVIGAEIMKSAIAAALLALFGILVYVAMRYEFSFAVGAVVAVVHDLLMTLGWFFLSGRELSAPIVAAVLTIIGFSINDTIVIFDRVREDLLLGRRGNFKELMNHALNQTLSRTIITAGTVFLSTLSLYMFGGGVINDFAFTFLVGILTGTYSSIFIACALVLWWHKGERPKNMIANPVVVDGQSIPV
jgi:SecD/SecF fusion protein